MKLWSWMIVGLCVLAWSAWAMEAVPLKIKVLKNNVNLRTKPNLTAEVVAQVSMNNVLVSKSMNSEWVEIMPPTNVDFWVLGDYVKDGVIQCRQNVNIRSGPGINFAIVGQLAPDKKVTVRGLFTEWVKIAPPEVCSLWISRSLVEMVADKPAKPKPIKVKLAQVEPVKTKAAAPAPAKKAVDKPIKKALSLQHAPKRKMVPVTQAMNDTATSVAAKEQPVVAADAPPDLDLIPSLGQGQWKQYDGTLRPRGVFFRTPSRFRLVSYDQDGHSATVCYVKGNNDQLSTLINRPMIISGREYWVKRQNYPVLIPERIVLK